MSKKILITSTNKHWGGSEHLWFETLKQLLTLDYHVTLILHKSILSEIFIDLENQPNLEIITLKNRRGSMFFKLYYRLSSVSFSISKLVDLKSFDLILISQGGSYEIVNDVDFCKSLQLNNLSYHVISQFHEDFGFLPDMFRKRVCAFFDEAQNVYYTSRRNMITSQSMLASSNHKNAVVGNPVRFEIKDDIKYFSLNTVKIITVGRLDVDLKGQNLLISALGKVNDTFSDWELVIWGEGKHSLYLNDLISSLGLDSKIKLEGFTESIKLELDKSDLFVLPSVAEGQSLALLEALSRGLIVAATDVGGASEIINHDINGFLIPGVNIDSIADSLIHVMNNRQNWGNVSQNAITAIKDYNLNNNAVNLLISNLIK
jgi:glycosyltransferase involved in cell wall biosynthesis